MSGRVFRGAVAPRRKEPVNKSIGQRRAILFDESFCMEVLNSSVSSSRSVFAATLCNPNYAKLLTGQIIAAFGDGINRTALLGIVIYVYGSANTVKYSADIFFWAMLPPVVLGLFAGALIDRWDRQRTMMVSDATRAILAASLPVVMIYLPHHYAIYTVVFLMGTFGALFAPARMAIMPNLVPREFLLPGNAISSQAGTVATTIAMPIGALIVENCHREVSFAINGLTYLFSIVFIQRLRPIQHQKSALQSGSSPWEDLKAGLKYIRTHPPILFYVVFTGLTQCLVSMFFISFLDYGVNVIGKTMVQKVFPPILLFGALAGGMAVGAMWLGWYSKMGERFQWPMMMLVVAGALIFFLGLIQVAWLVAVVLFGIGFCALMIMAPVDTYLQKHVPDELRGRVFVTRGVLVGAAFLVSLQFSKGMIHQLGVLRVLECLGIGAMIMGGVSGWLGRRWIKNEL